MSDVALEGTMLSYLMSDSHGVIDCLPMLTEDCFTTAPYRQLYRTICQLDAEGKEPNIVSVSDRLVNSAQSELGRDLVAQCAPLFSANGKDLPPLYMVHRLKEYALRRQLMEISGMLVKLYTDMRQPCDQGISEVQKRFEEITLGRSDRFITLGQVMDDVRQITLDNQNSETRHSGILTGFREFDETGGLPADGLIVVGAKTSHGKTTFAINIALAAVRHGHRAVCYSLEMGKNKLAGRILAMTSGVNANALMRLKLSQFELQRAHESIDALQQDVAQRFFFDSQEIFDLDALELSLRAMHRQHLVDVAVIDYLQLMQQMPGEKHETNNDLFSRICNRLHLVAEHEKIMIMLLSQFNRSFVGMPTLANFKDSSAIEQAADMAIILYNAAHDNANFEAPFAGVDPKGKLQIKVVKARDNGLPNFLVDFNPSLTLISTLQQGSVRNLPRQEELFFQPD